MKILYLDCSMGAAGDMLGAALLELLPDRDRFMEELNRIGIPGVHIVKETSVKCGITGTHLCVTVNGEEEESCDVRQGEQEHESGRAHEKKACHEQCHEDESCHAHDHAGSHTHYAHRHNSLHNIEYLIRDHLCLPDKVTNDVLAVYTLIAEAESKAHNRPVEEVHFHEVGAMDAIADIVTVCLLMNRIAPDKVIVSPIHVGSGQVRCAHGILPVPAPATAHILRDVPIYGGSIKGELCTPTGAALLKHFADRFGEMPVMRMTAVGYGMGKKDFEAVNCVRAMLGESASVQGGENAIQEKEELRNDTQVLAVDRICELNCNVDDMTAEAAGFAMERFFEAGALDVYTIPIGMKKNRPGILIHVMCRETDKEKLIESIFRYTTTIGIRENRFERYVLERRSEILDTPYGPVRCKISSGYGIERRKYEYDDLSRIAKERNLSISEAEALVREL